MSMGCYFREKSMPCIEHRLEVKCVCVCLHVFYVKSYMGFSVDQSRSTRIYVVKHMDPMCPAKYAYNNMHNLSSLRFFQI
jgi:hypothetical protein